MRPGARGLALVAACSVVLGACGSTGTSPSGSAPTNALAASPSPQASASSSADCQSLAGIPGPVDDHGTQIVSGSSIEIDSSDKMLTLSSYEHWFAPTCVVAKAGTTLSVTVKNIGKTLHNFTIESLNFDKDIQPGKSIHLLVKVSATDSVLFFCRYHLEKGQQGAFVPGQP